MSTSKSFKILPFLNKGFVTARIQTNDALTKSVHRASDHRAFFIPRFSVSALGSNTRGGEIVKLLLILESGPVSNFSFYVSNNKCYLHFNAENLTEEKCVLIIRRFFNFIYSKTFVRGNYNIFSKLVSIFKMNKDENNIRVQILIFGGKLYQISTILILKLGKICVLSITKNMLILNENLKVSRLIRE